MSTADDAFSGNLHTFCKWLGWFLLFLNFSTFFKNEGIKLNQHRTAAYYLCKRGFGWKTGKIRWANFLFIKQNHPSHFHSNQCTPNDGCFARTFGTKSLARFSAVGPWVRAPRAGKISKLGAQNEFCIVIFNDDFHQNLAKFLIFFRNFNLDSKKLAQGIFVCFWHLLWIRLKSDYAEPLRACNHQFWKHQFLVYHFFQIFQIQIFRHNFL